MPLLKIQTNTTVDKEQRKPLLSMASRAVAEALGKPERYVMVALTPNPDMVFAGNDAALAYLELKSIGLPESQTRDLSARLCGLMEETLGIPKERVYIEFANVSRSLWGWNGGTF